MLGIGLRRSASPGPPTLPQPGQCQQVTVDAQRGRSRGAAPRWPPNAFREDAQLVNYAFQSVCKGCGVHRRPGGPLLTCCAADDPRKLGKRRVWMGRCKRYTFAPTPLQPNPSNTFLYKSIEA
eukprot:359430-Chlamydomonas_euryale.AAC.5